MAWPPLAAHMVCDPDHVEIELLVHAEDVVQVVLRRSAGVAYHGPLHDGVGKARSMVSGEWCRWGRGGDKSCCH